MTEPKENFKARNVVLVYLLLSSIGRSSISYSLQVSHLLIGRHRMVKFPNTVVPINEFIQQIFVESSTLFQMLEIK